jgi:hypothetical protein
MSERHVATVREACWLAPVRDDGYLTGMGRIVVVYLLTLHHLEKEPSAFHELCRDTPGHLPCFSNNSSFTINKIIKLLTYPGSA